MHTFFLGILLITLSEITSSSIEYYSYKRNIFIFLPFLIIIFSYLYLIIKSSSPKEIKNMIIKFYQNYLIRTFLKELVIVFLFFYVVNIYFKCYLSEIRFFMNLNLGFYYPIFITLLNLPSVIFEIFPFIILISTQLFFVKLYEKNELIILKNYGIDNIKLLNILILTAIIIGLLITTVFLYFFIKFKTFIIYILKINIQMIKNIWLL